METSGLIRAPMSSESRQLRLHRSQDVYGTPWSRESILGSRRNLALNLSILWCLRAKEDLMQSINLWSQVQILEVAWIDKALNSSMKRRTWKPQLLSSSRTKRKSFPGKRRLPSRPQTWISLSPSNSSQSLFQERKWHHNKTKTIGWL